MEKQQFIPWIKERVQFEIPVGYPDRYTSYEGRSTQRSEICNSNSKDDNSPHIKIT